jgi:hypothetical protein
MAADVTPLSATNGGSTVNLWQATPGYFPNYPTYNQTYGGVGSPYADIGAQIRDAMQNSGLIAGAPANPFGGNALPRYNFARSSIGQNQVPMNLGTGQPHGLLGSAAQASIFNQYHQPVPPANNQGGGPQLSGGDNFAPPSGGLLNPQQPATPVPPSMNGDKAGLGKGGLISQPGYTPPNLATQQPTAQGVSPLSDRISVFNSNPNWTAQQKFAYVSQPGNSDLMNYLVQSNNPFMAQFNDAGSGYRAGPTALGVPVVGGYK